MTAMKKAHPAGIVKATDESASADIAVLLPEDDEDAMDALLQRMSGGACHRIDPGSVYRDLEEHDYIGEHALQIVIEDLQFGHDLRL